MPICNPSSSYDCFSLLNCLSFPNCQVSKGKRKGKGKVKASKRRASRGRSSERKAGKKTRSAGLRRLRHIKSMSSHNEIPEDQHELAHEPAHEHETPKSKSKRPKNNSMGKNRKPVDCEKAPDSEPAKKKQKNRFDGSQSPEPWMVLALVRLLNRCANEEYDSEKLTMHEQVYGSIKLNIYWSKNGVGLTLRENGKAKDLANFTSKTPTITTHLQQAKWVVRTLIVPCSFM